MCKQYGSIYFYFSLQPVSNADFIVPVEIDGIIHQVCETVALGIICDYVLGIPQILWIFLYHSILLWHPYYVS